MVCRMASANVSSRAAPQLPARREALLGLRCWWSKWVQAWRKRRLVVRLAAMDERMLKDIGIERSDGTLAARVRAYRELRAEQARMSRLGLM